MIFSHSATTINDPQTFSFDDSESNSDIRNLPRTRLISRSIADLHLGSRPVLSHCPGMGVWNGGSEEGQGWQRGKKL